MDFTELPRLLGWADFQPAYIFGLMQKLQNPHPSKTKLISWKRHFYPEIEQDSVRSLLS